MKRCLPAVLLLLTASCSKKEEPEPEPIAPVQIAPVTRESIRRIVTADGVLWPRDQASVMPKISAPVQKFLVKRGDHVRQGQLLAVLENRDLAASATESKGQLAQAESNLRQTQSATVPEQVTKAQTDVEAARQAEEAARKLLESRQKLLEQGALARRLVGEAQVAYTQARSQYLAAQEHLRALQSVGKEEQVKTAAAQVEAARGHYQSAEAQLAYAEVHSPINGVISDRPLYAGEMASAGSPLLTVVDISRIVARVNVPQNQIAHVKAGNLAILVAADTSAQLTGRVTVVSPAADPNTTTVQVWVEADNPGERLKPGTPVQAAIVTDTIPDAVVVPAAALLPGSEGGTSIMTVGADNLAHEKKVEVGVRESDKVQILSGAAPGEQVITVGGVGLQDKAKVRIVKPGEKPEEEKDEKK